MADDEFEVRVLPDNPTPEQLTEHFQWLQQTIVKVERKMKELHMIRSALLQEQNVVRALIEQAAPERLGQVMETEMRFRRTAPQNLKARPFVEKAILGVLRAYPGLQPIEYVVGWTVEIHKQLDPDEVRQAIMDMAATGEIASQDKKVGLV